MSSYKKINNLKKILGFFIAILMLAFIAFLFVSYMLTGGTVTPTAYFHPDLASVKNICVASCTASPYITYGPTEVISEDNTVREDPNFAKALCILHYKAINKFFATDTLSPFKIARFENSLIPSLDLSTKSYRRKKYVVSASDQLLSVHPNFLHPDDIKKYRNLFLFMKTDAALLIYSEYNFVIHSEGIRRFWRAVVTSNVYLIGNSGNFLWATYNLKGVSSKVKASKGIDLVLLQWSELSSAQILAIFREAALNNACNLGNEIKTDIAYLRQHNIVKPTGVQKRKRLFGTKIAE
jgi:hypothetical protein